MRSVLYTIFFLVLFLGARAQTAKTDLNYGLAFASHEVSKDHRTSLTLNPKEPFYFQDDFELRFDLAFQRLINAYGYIVRIVANDSLNIDLVSAPEHEEFSDLTLIINNTRTTLHFEFSDIALQAAQWTTVRIAFSQKHQTISLSWNEKTKTQSVSLKNLKNFRFHFGANDVGKFKTSDAPPIMVKDVSLLQGQKPLYKWILKEHQRDNVYDSIKHLSAAVTNPSWLVDHHTKWVQRSHFTIGRFPSAAFNSDSAILYLIDKHNLYRYDLAKEKLKKKRVKAGNPVYTDANQLLYIKESHTLINYDLPSHKFIAYNFDNNTWPHTDTTYHEPDYWHNNKFFNARDSSFYTFGGYGHFTYKNSLFRFDATTATWVKVKTKDSIPPRYLAAAGLIPSTNEVLIFGGYGSVSGKQELSPQSFYDLYSFNLENHDIKKIWEFPETHTTADRVFSNSLVVNEKDRCFYVLSFPKNKYQSTIKLSRFSLDKPEEKILADSIPFKFHDEHSFCDLFLSETTKELIAVTVHKEKDQYQVHVHSINYPPLQLEDVLQPVDPSENTATALAITITVSALAALLLALVLKRKKRSGVAPAGSRNNVPPKEESTAPVIPILHDDPKLTSAILLFGGFQVFDKDGNDISGKFTMTLKELFALILLHSVKFEKGIATTVLQEYLWPDKDEVSARNNRNVNIKKLRTLLKDLDDVSIETNNAYLRLNMSDPVFCDYQTVYKVLSHDKTTLSEREKISILLKEVKRGSLLPNLQTSWLDNFKSDISNQIIDALLEYAQKLNSDVDDKLLLEIADAIFNYDSINQEALVIKCSVLNKKGKYSLAKTWYDHFVKEYRSLYAENYSRTFEEVISQEQPS